MTEYAIEFVRSAEKEFRALTLSDQIRIAAAIDVLRQTPRRRGTRKISGKKDLFRLRVGVNRVVYQIDDDKKVISIMRVKHRREAYR